MTVDIQGMAPLLQVFDMRASLRFYRDVLGFKLEDSSGSGDDVDWVLLKLNDVELMLNTTYEKQERPATPEPQRRTGHADISLYFGCPDIDVAYKHLVEKQLEVESPVITKYGWKALTVRDPDGYCLCFHWPPGEI